MQISGPNRLLSRDRLRKMNVGEDFFGPSLSNILDSFDRINYSDSTVNKMKRELSRSSARANGDATAPISNGIDANAQQAINEVRQKRADAEGKRRNSADTTGVAPSFAAVWLLNQAQGSNDSAAARGGLTDEAGDKTVTASQAPAEADTAVTRPDEPKVSVLDRPRPVARKPKEAEEISPAEAQVEAEKPQEPIRQDASNAMATSGPQPIVPNADAAPAATQSNETTPKKVTEIVAGKDSPTPVKSASKPKQPRSLADTLFGISFRSPSKERKEKKEKKEKAKKEKKEKKDKDKKDKKAKSTHSRTTRLIRPPPRPPEAIPRRWYLLQHRHPSSLSANSAQLRIPASQLRRHSSPTASCHPRRQPTLQRRLRAWATFRARQVSQVLPRSSTPLMISRRWRTRPSPSIRQR